MIIVRVPDVLISSCKSTIKWTMVSQECTVFTKVVFFFVSAHDKTYNKTCATSEDSDQPARPRSLIRVFADRMCLLQPPGYPKRDKQEPLPYWVDVQVDLSLCWSHTSYCKFCHALAQTLLISLHYHMRCNTKNIPTGMCDQQRFR